MKYSNKTKYILQIADNALIIGERLAQWCGHAHELEQDIAMTNIALDQIGQAQYLYKYAADIEGGEINEDHFPFHRLETQFSNLLLVEQENIDFAYTIIRQFLYDSFNYLFLQELSSSNDKNLSDYANKSLIEVKYHLRYSRDWVLRLGDGTTESNQRTQDAVNDLYMYSKEAFDMSETDKIAFQEGYGVDLNKIQKPFIDQTNKLFFEANLAIPSNEYYQSGGKTGRHTEHLGHILSETQYLQRAYPGLQW